MTSLIQGGIFVFHLLHGALVPVPQRMDYAGYCQHEFKEGHFDKSGYIVTHRFQGTWFATKSAYEACMGITGNQFQLEKDEIGEDHVFGLTRLNFNWGTVIDIDDRKDLSKTSCWVTIPPQ